MKYRAYFSESGSVFGCRFMLRLALIVSAGLWATGSDSADAASYRLYRSVSQAWAARGFEINPPRATRSYSTPGPASDPWGPYIQEAAQRFSLPEKWIRAVMHQESGGQQYLNGGLTTSDAGAMGLMQLMPGTYSDMRDQYGLGSDPYDPHDNIQAGTAYIRLMYDKFGAPGFLAAYNAGPDRVTAYLNNGEPLPDETVNYVASITPNLGSDVVLRGPWASVAGPTTQADAISGPPEVYYTNAVLTRTADGCLRDANAAYDPAAPCLVERDTPHPNPAPDEEDTAPAVVAAPAMVASVSQTNLDAPAIKPAAKQPVRAVIYRPVAPAAMQVAEVSYGASAHRSPAPHMLTLPAGALHKSATPPAMRSGVTTLPAHTVLAAGMQGHRVQIGAFASYADAKRSAEKGARVLASRSVVATPSVMPVSVAGKSFYRAQLIANNGHQARGLCQVLQAKSMPCIQVKDG